MHLFDRNAVSVQRDGNALGISWTFWPENHYTARCDGTGRRVCRAGRFCLFAECTGAVDCSACRDCIGDDIAELYLDLGAPVG